MHYDNEEMPTAAPRSIDILGGDDITSDDDDLGSMVSSQQLTGQSSPTGNDITHLMMRNDRTSTLAPTKRQKHTELDDFLRHAAEKRKQQRLSASAPLAPIPESHLPTALTGQQRGVLRDTLTLLRRVEDVGQALTGLKEGRSDRVAGRRATHNLGVSHRSMCEALQALWERYRIAPVERNAIRDKHFHLATRDNFNTVAKLVAELALRPAHGTHMHHLLNLREATFHAVLEAASSPIAESVTADEVDCTSLGSYIVNMLAVLRYSTVAILQYVDFLRRSRSGQATTEDATLGIDSADEEPSRPASPATQQEGRPPSRVARRLRNMDQFAMPQEFTKRGATGDASFDALGDAEREAAISSFLEWEGTNYLVKIVRDMDRLETTPVGKLLAARGVVLRGNPLVLPPGSVDVLDQTRALLTPHASSVKFDSPLRAPSFSCPGGYAERERSG
jgi:hypothetical protein